MKAKSCKELLDAYELKPRIKKSKKLIFTGVGGKDVYNITAPFGDDGSLVIAGRVEDRNSENSKVKFFVDNNGVLSPKKGAREFELQDPFVTKINGELIFGGVYIYPHPEIEGSLGYKTVFYRGNTIETLEKFAEGTEMMKDIRLAKLPNGEILVLTRPQGEVGGRGKIGFIKIKSIDNLNADTINSAKIIENQFVNEEWGGSNEIHILNDTLVGVLGHIASFDEYGNRHYYPMAYSFNIDTNEASEIKIIAKRGDLPSGSAKRSDLADVLFSGGIIRENNGEAELYVGVSDAEAHKILIEDPFTEYVK